MKKRIRAGSREFWGECGWWEGYIYYLNLKYFPVANSFKISPSYLSAMVTTRSGSDPFEFYLFDVLFSTCEWADLQNGQQARKSKTILADQVSLFYYPLQHLLKTKLLSGYRWKYIVLPGTHQLLSLKGYGTLLLPFLYNSSFFSLLASWRK